MNIYLRTGDLLDEEKVSRWLTSQEAFEVKDEIEEVNRKMLSKLLDENEFVAVYFCQFWLVTYIPVIYDNMTTHRK